MRIVLLASSYSPHVGGVEEFTAKLAARLIGCGHSVQVWTSRHAPDPLPERELCAGIEVLRFDFPLPRAAAGPLLAWPVGAMRTVNAMRNAHRAFMPDIVNVHCFSGNGIYGTALSQLTPSALVVSLHGETLMDANDIYDRSATLRSGLRWGLKRAAAVTACSTLTLDDAVHRFGLTKDTAGVVFNAIELDEGMAEDFALPFARYVLALGRMVTKKGFDLLLEAFADVPGTVGLVLAGDGPERSALERRAVRLGLGSRVHFTGTLNRGQVQSVMSGAACLVVPSRVEPFGLVALEAWRAGIPLLATSRGGPSEFVRHGEDGILVDPEDRAALTTAVRSVVDRPEAFAAMAVAGRMRLPEFSWERVTRQFTEVYAAALR